MTSHAKNGMDLRIILKSLHASFRQRRNKPFVKTWYQGLPSNRRICVKSLTLFAGQTRALVLMPAPFWMEQILGIIDVYKLAQCLYDDFGIGQQVFVSKESVIREVLELDMLQRRSAVLSDNKPDRQLPDQPAEPGMLQHPNRRARWIICFRHRHCPRISSDMNYFALGKPRHQFGNMSNVDGEFDTGSFAAAEFSNFINQYSCNRPDGSI